LSQKPCIQTFLWSTYRYMEDTEAIKKALGEKAAHLIQDGMIVGLGSGTTSQYFIDSLIERCKDGLSISAVSSSEESLKHAQKGGIKTYPLNEATHIDITIDGADEMDPKKRMIKGGGGCHLQEKILAYNSKEMIVIIDESKLSEKLGHKKLPVEVVYFGATFTERTLREKGYQGFFRKNDEGTLFFTENANLLYDIEFESPLDNPEDIHHDIMMIPGVVDTGFFFNLAGRTLVGFFDGRIETH